MTAESKTAGTPDGCCAVTDTSGSILAASAEAATLLGLTPKKLVGRSLCLFFDRDRTAALRSARLAAAGQPVAPFNCRVRPLERRSFRFGYLQIDSGAGGSTAFAVDIRDFARCLTAWCLVPPTDRTRTRSSSAKGESTRRSIVREQGHHVLLNEQETRGPFRRDLLGTRRGCRKAVEELGTSVLAFDAHAIAPLSFRGYRCGVDPGQCLADQRDVAALKGEAWRDALDRIRGSVRR